MPDKLVVYDFTSDAVDCCTAERNSPLKRPMFDGADALTVLPTSGDVICLHDVTHGTISNV